MDQIVKLAKLMIKRPHSTYFYQADAMLVHQESVNSPMHSAQVLQH
jgi:hypothetical protein